VIPPGLVLGRGSECDVRIEDPGVSRRHAEIRVQGSGPDAQLMVVDLGSTNGTVVDGVRAAQAPLADGSRIVLGSTVVDVHRRAPRR
jgi:pSer/pThr/pTyr-binding forkhead associated (FHA) protein